MKAKKGKSGYMEPCGHVETPAKVKSRIKKFEQCLDYNHRLALTYASNQPGDVPPVPTSAYDNETRGEASKRLGIKNPEAAGRAARIEAARGLTPGPPKMGPETPGTMPVGKRRRGY